MSTRKAHSEITYLPGRSPVRQQPIRYPSLAKSALIVGVSASPLTRYDPIGQPSSKMRLSGPPGGYEWGVD
jgi:hypothetical protein